LLKKIQFQDVIFLTTKILTDDPLNKEAIQLKNEALYQIGMKLSRQEKYFEAIDTFKKIIPENKEVNGAIRAAIQHELQKAENLLKEMKYDESVSLSGKILGYDPSNTAARNLVSTALCQKGKVLFKRQKYNKALHVLDKADPVNTCIKKMRLAVHKAIKQQAETHYIKGVKYFLNEDLQSAIKEWEKTLKLDPKHDKAKKNIKNARSLLEKLNNVK